ncbi:acyl carrier protein [Phenylobacterium sp. LjRoot219]|uniref:acyl carrier protein n=1 Tax=Phenylobacterium sp. LjRoot219 TaxID=3342283 RepID=UPI003ECCF014
MSEQDPALLTNAQLAATPASERVRRVEAYLLASIRALHPDTPVDVSCRLADLAIDSLQVVELKFGLDQVLGQELDVELIVSNPTVGELAANSVSAAGL